MWDGGPPLENGRSVNSWFVHTPRYTWLEVRIRCCMQFPVLLCSAWLPLLGVILFFLFVDVCCTSYIDIALVILLLLPLLLLFLLIFIILVRIVYSHPHNLGPPSIHHWPPPPAAAAASSSSSSSISISIPLEFVWVSSTSNTCHECCTCLQERCDGWVLTGTNQKDLISTLPLITDYHNYMPFVPLRFLSSLRALNSWMATY